MKKKMIPVIVAIVLILIIGVIGVGTIVFEKYSYSKERADLNEYFEIFAADEVPIILQDERIPERAKIIEGAYYFDFDTVQTYFNDRFYADSNEGLLLYTTPTETIRVTIGGEDKKAVMMDDRLYVAADYVKQYTNFSYEPFTEPNRMQVYTEWNTVKKADIKKDTWVRQKGGVKSDILRDMTAGETVIILEEMENWSRVKTSDAITGYVENKRLTNQREEALPPVTDYVEPEYTRIKKDYKISLAWHQVTNMEANNYLSNVLATTKSINTISPTWFYLNDNYGNFVSIASKAYVDAAHQRGIEVWALVENITYRNEIDMQEILSYTSKREYLVRNLVDTVMQYGIDGINVDFEMIPEGTGEHYIQFIRELSVACRTNGIVLSVDNYVPREYSAHYHRKEQGVVADYVVIMGYDEHWHNSGKAGSVASIGYVDDGIALTLQEGVPADKIVNGIPFYTNVWKTVGSDTTDSQVGMEAAENFLRSKGVEAAWDEETCQNYAGFQDGDAFYQVWLEDEQSIGVKLNIMDKHEIAGVAMWKLGLEKQSIWWVIENYVQGEKLTQ